MAMEMEIGFPGGRKIETGFKGTTITVGSDIEGEPALEPLDLFFVSLGLCAGKYVMEFFRTRDLPYEETKILLSTQWDEDKKMHTQVLIRIQLPKEFPEKYKKAVIKTVNLCSVKKHIFAPPTFEVEADIAS
jgi:ribosomal protein S12 methylthiotransferase accessory factor